MRALRTQIITLRSCSASKWQIDSFRWRWYETQLPVKYNSREFFRENDLPAERTWVTQVYSQPQQRKFTGFTQLNSEHLVEHGDVTVPMERTVWSHDDRTIRSVKSFERFEAPLSAFLEWTKQKLAAPDAFAPHESLYIAQCPITSLPPPLRDELPPPVYCTQRTSKKLKFKRRKRFVPWDHIEGSSLWMGLPPTETPLHKDPNNNFLAQVAGFKVLRIMTPNDGEFMLSYAKREIQKSQHVPGHMSMSMRGEEMMAGAERELMSELVWGLPYEEGKSKFRQELEEKHNGWSKDLDPAWLKQVTDFHGLVELEPVEAGTQAEPEDSENKDKSTKFRIFETMLKPGDAVFIPKGWYHSVRSLGSFKSGINISANWWFRFDTPSRLVMQPVRDEQERNIDPGYKRLDLTTITKGMKRPTHGRGRRNR